jgi:hypothetical protein
MARKSVWEIWQGKDGKWYYHARSPFGKVSEPSQGYSTKANAKRAAKNDEEDREVVELTILEEPELAEA